MPRLDLIGEETVRLTFAEMPFKGRPKFTKTGHTYTPSKTAKTEKYIRDQWQKQVGSYWDEHRGPVKVYLEIARPQAKNSKDGAQDLQKPDIDNIGKVFLDALNKLAWKDDSQVVEFEVAKLPRQKSKEQVEACLRVRYYLEAL